LLERIKNVEEGKELIQISEDDIKNML
jgi:hypothetical protein